VSSITSFKAFSKPNSLLSSVTAGSLLCTRIILSVAQVETAPLSTSLTISTLFIFTESPDSFSAVEVK
jgi:hypothetical protein